MSGRPRSATFPALSTTVTIVGVGVHPWNLAWAAAAGRRLAADWEARFSRFRPDSLLSKLNAADGRPVRVDGPFLDLLDKAARAVGETAGRFDPSILPALEAAGYTADIGRVRAGAAAPAGEARAGAGAAGWAAVGIDRERGEANLPAGMRIDLGGLAKGAFVDRLADELAGWPGGCVDAGGDLHCWGHGPDGGRWLVGVEDPGAPDRDALVLRLDGEAGAGIATSGPHRRRWDGPSGAAHHLIDPRTGRPLAGPPRAVTAIAADATTAEVVAKDALIALATNAPPLRTAAAVIVLGDGAPFLVAGALPDAIPVSFLAPNPHSA